jgi:chromate transporter
MPVRGMNMSRRIGIADRNDGFRTGFVLGGARVSDHGPLAGKIGPISQAGQPHTGLYAGSGTFKANVIVALFAQVIKDRPTPGIADLFLGFLSLGLLGFGGIAPWARYIIVERRAWLSEKEYAEFIGIGQVLPGSNTVNAAILIGQRFHGLPGAVVAVTALMTMPLLVLVVLASLYGRFATYPDVGAGLAGTAAAAAGLVIGTAIKMTLRLRPTPIALLFGTAAFVAAGLLMLPLLPTLGLLIPLSLCARLVVRR